MTTFSIDGFNLHLADVLDWAREYAERIARGEARPISAWFFDPPYGLGDPPPMDELLRAWLDDQAYDTGKGFMSAKWDVVPPPFVFRAFRRISYPGCWLFAFGGTRTVDLLCMSLRLGGWVKRDEITHWVYGCLSEDTEILTKDGWVTFDQSLVGSMVMCYNVSDDSLEWHQVQETFAYAYADTAYRIKSDSTDQLVSRNHRCLVERGRSYVYERAEKLNQKEKVPVLASMPDMQGCLLEDTSVDKEECCKYMQSTVCRHLEIQQPRAPRASKKNSWRGTCRVDRKELGVLSRKNERLEQSRLEGRCNLFQKEGQLRQAQHQICSLSKRVSGNGAQGQVCNGAQVACSAMPGTCTEKIGGSTPQRPQPGKQCTGQLDAFCKQQSAQEIRSKRRTRATLATVTPVHYEGTVWCVRVPTGAFVAKRNGMVFITGNSGFPKSLNIGKALDREAGAEREVVGKNPNARPNSGRTGGIMGEAKGQVFNTELTAPATPLAQLFDGYGTALKPAVEPVVMFQAPRQGHTFAGLAREFGTGGLNVEASRVGLSSEKLPRGSGNRKSWRKMEKRTDVPGPPEGGNVTASSGRFPPNAFFTHLPPSPCPTCHTSGVLSTKALGLQGGGVPDEVECPTCQGAGWTGGCKRVGSKRVKGPGMQKGTGKDFGYTTTEVYGKTTGIGKRRGDGYAAPDGTETVDDFVCDDQCAVKLLGEQSGERRSAGLINRTEGQTKNSATYNFGKTFAETGVNSYSDKGTAARYFKNFTHDLNLAPFYYCSKMGASRHAGLVANLPRTRDERKRRHQDLSGSWLKRAVSRNPCRKPLKLTGILAKSLESLMYLSRMLKPPDEFEPVLAVPFAGEFSEVIGAALAGWKHIEVVEREVSYFYRGRAALEWWLEWAHNTQSDDPATIRKLAKKADPPPANANGEVQMDMFSTIEEATG